MIVLQKDQSLEDAFLACPENDLPSIIPAKGEKPYKDQYKDLARALTPVQNDSGIGAAISSIKKLVVELGKATSLKEKQEAVDNNPITFLNCHGPAHIGKVITYVSRILFFCENQNLSPFEAFLLLCSIQIHDTGNIFGRDGHEQHVLYIMEKTCNSSVTNFVHRRYIASIAKAHGGKVNGDKDTISSLTTEIGREKEYFRPQMLAALLRFADELADDYSRADLEALKYGIMVDDSEIYHHYSKALNSVSIDKDKNGNIEVFMNFCIESDSIKKYANSKFLVDEIYSRTIKMENERRYCMQFLRKYISITRINVVIDIYLNPVGLVEENATEPYRISYFLEEKGYPTELKLESLDKILSNPEHKSGESVYNALKEKGWVKE